MVRERAQEPETERVCVCVCVCERERVRVGGWGGGLGGGGGGVRKSLFLSLSLTHTHLHTQMYVFWTELFVDWIKHAFVTKFNKIEPEVYERSLSLSFYLYRRYSEVRRELIWQCTGTER
jgi:hypothetical protein